MKLVLTLTDRVRHERNGERMVKGTLLLSLSCMLTRIAFPTNERDKDSRANSHCSHFRFSFSFPLVVPRQS